MKRPILLALLLASLASPLAHALDVAEAYAAIPHRRTPYDVSLSPSAAAQKASLARLFAHTDKGVVLRVEGMNAHKARDAAGVKRVVDQYGVLIADLEKEPVAPEVAPARSLIVEALKLQRRHLQSQPAGGLVFVRRDIVRIPDVQDSSQKLQQAYGVLMKTFPAEAQRNRTSFFDHLCALDFL